MAIITISIEAEIEKKLREFALGRYGNRKGSIGKTVTEAINILVGSAKEGTAEERLMKRTETGFHLGRINSKKLREDIYNGRIKSI